MSNHERQIVRDLAAAVAELAQLPIQQERYDAWVRNNGLRPNRPMVYMAEAEMPWGEIAAACPDVRCQCQDPDLQAIEGRLRRKLFIARHLETDHVVEGVWWVGKVITGLDFGLPVEEQKVEQAGSEIASRHFEPVLREPEDVAKIQMPCVRYDEAATRANLARMQELLGDILTVKLAGRRTHTFNSWDTVVCWTGIEEGLTELILRPEFCHAIMRRLTDAVLSRMDQMEALGLLDAPNPQATVGSGAAGYTDELPSAGCDGEHYRYADLWGSATSQIFGEVSPSMHEEFALNYELETLRRCGLTYYGCCEPLHNKMQILGKIPNLRKVSISPWCDTAKALENATRKYVFSHKPNPAVFASDQFSLAAAEADVRHRLDHSGEMNCEIIAKDISTVRGDVQRLIDWTRMAMRLARAHE